MPVKPRRRPEELGSGLGFTPRSVAETSGILPLRKDLRGLQSLFLHAA